MSLNHAPDSVSTSHDAYPCWESAVGANIDIEAAAGSVPRWFSVTNGGLLSVVTAKGNARVLPVVDGGVYSLGVRSIVASGSTAFGLIFGE
jgi:hypothetical protein